MTMHQEWTDKLSDYLDDELEERERSAVEAHLQGCAACTAVLNDLKRIVARAQSLDARPPQTDLWDGIAIRGTGLGRTLTSSAAWQRRRVSFTLAQLAAAAVLIAAVSGGLVWQFAPELGGLRSRGSETGQRAESVRPAPTDDTDRARPDNVDVVPISLADDQYDAAVADLERALKQGRGKLDASTIAVVEQNLQTIDQAIAQAREALASDPANSYLTGHLVEARRRKLDLLRRATALTDMD